MVLETKERLEKGVCLTESECCGGGALEFGGGGGYLYEPRVRSWRCHGLLSLVFGNRAGSEDSLKMQLDFYGCDDEEVVIIITT